MQGACRVVAFGHKQDDMRIVCEVPSGRIPNPDASEMQVLTFHWIPKLIPLPILSDFGLAHVPKPNSCHFTYQDSLGHCDTQNPCRTPFAFHFLVDSPFPSKTPTNALPSNTLIYTSIDRSRRPHHFGVLFSPFSIRFFYRTEQMQYSDPTPKLNPKPWFVGKGDRK